jgi:pimeloyl-[acyl-carrier protein] methyl ester esterase
MQLLLNWDLRPSLSLLSMPVDYVFGRLDAIIPVQLHGLMQSQYPQFNYHCIRQSAHMPFISHPLIIQEILQSTAE